MNQAINQNQRPLILTGEKVARAMMVADDVEAFAAWYQDLEFTKMLGTPGELQTVEMRRECFNRAGSRPSFSAVEFALMATASRELVGFGGLFDMTRGVAAELFMGISPAHWRKGYGTECVRLITTYGFSYLSLNCIHLSVHSYNTGAIQCYEKAGFKQAGRLRGVLWLDGFRYDEILMDQIRNEFKSENQVPTTN
jgi:RimJ/RimL family protein N-acetyltransferase